MPQINPFHSAWAVCTVQPPLHYLRRIIWRYSSRSYRLICNKSHRRVIAIWFMFLHTMCAARRLPFPSVTMAIPSPVPGKVHFWIHRDFYIRTHEAEPVCIHSTENNAYFFLTLLQATHDQNVSGISFPVRTERVVCDYVHNNNSSDSSAGSI